MAVSHAKKVEIVQDLENAVVPQKAVVILTTHGAEQSLDSTANFQARKEARTKGVVLKVVKNTLIKRSFQSVPDLVGPSYLAYLQDSDQSDEVTVPKIIVDIVNKDFKNQFGIVGSVVNGEFYDSAKTEVLSKTPTLQDSMAMLAGALNQLATKIAIGVKEVPTGLARAVSAYGDTLKS